MTHTPAQWLDALQPTREQRKDHSPKPLEIIAAVKYQAKTAQQVSGEVGKHIDVVWKHLGRARDLGLVEIVGKAEEKRRGPRAVLWKMRTE